MDNYVLGLELMIIGMGTVFLSLYLLSVFLHFSGKFLAPVNKNKIKKTDKISKSSTKKKVDIADTDQEQSFSSKKIAAVTSAIYESLNDQKTYRIISIQKSKQNWKR